jgi:hypothetical protein
MNHRDDNSSCRASLSQDLGSNTEATVRKISFPSSDLCHSTSPQYQKYRSRDGSVGIALGYGLDDLGSRFRFPAEAGNFSLHHRVQNGSGVHPASYPMGARGSFLWGKAAGAWS